MTTKYEFRDILPEELDQVIQIEQICFPPNEACSAKSMRERVANAPETFMVAVDKETGKVAGFLNGVATDEAVFRDEFFTDSTLHNPEGKNVMLLGLDVLPEYRHQGLAREIMTQYVEREQKRGRECLYLTCLASIPLMLRWWQVIPLRQMRMLFCMTPWLLFIQPAEALWGRITVQGKEKECETVIWSAWLIPLELEP